MSTLADALKEIGTPSSAGPQGPSRDLDAFSRLISVLLEEAGVPDVPEALDSLKDAGLADPHALANRPTIDLLNLLRTSAPRVAPRVAATIKHLAEWLVEFENGQPERLDDLDRSTQSLRDALGSIKGVGRGMADSLVLHALARPAFPVDRGTYRILVRHGWLDLTADYDEAHDLVVHHADSRIDLLVSAEQAFALIARRHCRVQAPACAGCPLEAFLPEGGAVEIDA